ncbi:MAG: hypothetical protein ACLQSR_00515 [Limisphaerales bacterium]
MIATTREKREATLPQGASLQRLGEVLLDAWLADPRRWMNAAVELRDKAPERTMPAPRDAMDLFRVLAERQTDYLLVGGLAMLTYVKGRNTRDVDLLMSVAALEKIPEIVVEDKSEFFARGKFKSVQVDVLLTRNPLFKMVAEAFSTRHSFAELEIPAATAEGLIVLKLYALPSLYWQFDMDRAAVYENDITLLIARHSPVIEPLIALAIKDMEPSDQVELQKIAAECRQRAKLLQQRAGQ